MKDIVKQFKKSLSELTPEEFKKVWDEIEAEIGTDYPIFNAKTKCFEYKINNTETLEQAIEDIKEYLIGLCEAPNYEEDNYTAGYIAAIDEKTSEIFKAGVEFAQRWISVDDELPNYYQIVLADNDKYMAIVARVSDGDEEYYPICGTDVIMSPDPIKWRPIELK